MTTLANQTPATQSLTGQPVSTSPARCERNDWCAKGPGHLFGCEGKLIELRSPWASDDAHYILRGQLSHDDEINETKVVFDAGSDDWVTFDSGSEFRAYIGSIRAHLDRLYAESYKYDRIIAQEKLQALLAEHGAEVLEFEPGARDSLPCNVLVWSGLVDGKYTFVFPHGQDPAISIQVTREAIAKLGARG